MRRALAIAIGAVGVLLAGADYQSYADVQTWARTEMVHQGLDTRHAELAGEVRRRYDPVHARLRIAQALLNDELDRRWLAGLTEEEIATELERGPARLRAASEIAREAWPARAASWQAAMILGGSTYLDRFRSNDPRFLAERDAWEKPLRAALELAPAERGPLRFLASAYIGNWASLDREERQATTELVARAFEERRTYELLVRDWLRVASSRSQALATVPARPWAWRVLEQHFTELGDWELFVEARRRWYETLAVDIVRELDEVELLLTGGEVRDARSRLLHLLERIPHSGDYAPQVERLLNLLPAGPVGAGTAATFEAWLAWAFEHCVREACPLSPESISRLARLTTDLAPESRALAALAAGDFPRAELIERRYSTHANETWAGYHLLKAELLLRLDRLADADASLAQLSSAFRTEPRYWLAERDLATALDEEGRHDLADLRLGELADSRWSEAAWERTEGRYRLELLPTRAADGISIEVVGAAAGGSVVEVYLDGRLLDIRRSSRSRAIYRFDQPLSPELHQLSLRFHTGGSVRPGDVELL